MKFVKKLTALFLAVCMVMAMGITAFAEGTGYTISTKSDDTHTYSVYQILTGDLSADGVLSNIKAGSNYNSSKGDAAAAAEAIAAFTDQGQALADKIAEYASMGKGTTPYGTVSASSSLTNVPAGYYLIKDNGAEDMTGDSYSTYIVKVVKDVEISPKKSVPSFEKKVDDVNDSDTTTTADNGKLQDSADYDIGDSVPFTLKATLPNNYTDYTVYYLQFQDQMEKGLTFNNDVKVYLGETEIDSSKYTVASSAYSSDGNASITADGATAFTVTFDNLKAAVPNATNESVITVEFTAKLNNQAVVGQTGNVNEARLQYSNNPNDKQGGEKGETPWDNVIVFTYKVVINKVDSDKKALKGAAFELQKWDATTSQYKTVKKIDAGETTTFTFSGLDDGKYKLIETTTPSGYNTIDPIEFTVTAAHDIAWDTQSRNAILTSLAGNKVTGEITFTPDKAAGSLTSEVVNKKGAELPSTGGMGTAVIYVAGIAMIVAAGVVVIARKRMA